MSCGSLCRALLRCLPAQANRQRDLIALRLTHPSSTFKALTLTLTRPIQQTRNPGRPGAWPGPNETTQIGPECISLKPPKQAATFGTPYPFPNRGVPVGVQVHNDPSEFQGFRFAPPLATFCRPVGTQFWRELSTAINQ